MEEIKKKQLILAISGVKNSGKTTLIENIIPILKKSNFVVATIKHDGHDFEPDVPNTDTYKHKKSGAYGVGIFSNNRFMVIKDKKIDESDMMKFFPEADIILIEGFKNSDIEKIEIIRSVVYDKPVCTKNVIGIVSDSYIDESIDNNFFLNDYKKLAKFIIKLYNSMKS